MKRPIPIVVGAALAGSLAFACSKQAPPILAGIDCASPDNCAAASKRFSDRLLTKYPLGSRQDILDRDLTAQGFTREYQGITHCTKPGQVEKVGTTGVDCIPQDLNWNPQHALSASNCGSSLFCNRYAILVWSSDTEGRITYLNAGYVVTKGLAGL